MITDMLKNKQGGWDWPKIAISIFIVLVLPLIGLVYNNMAGDIQDARVTARMDIARIEAAVEKKVSEKTMKQYMARQQQQTDMLQVDLQEQKVIDKEMLKTLQRLNVNMVLVEHQLKTQ